MNKRGYGTRGIRLRTSKIYCWTSQRRLQGLL
jgi:hypothetical protein